MPEIRARYQLPPGPLPPEYQHLPDGSSIGFVDENGVGTYYTPESIWAEYNAKQVLGKVFKLDQTIVAITKTGGVMCLTKDGWSPMHSEGNIEELCNG